MDSETAPGLPSRHGGGTRLLVPTAPKCVRGTPVQGPVWGLGRPSPQPRIPLLKVQAGEGTQPPAHLPPCKDWRPWASRAGRCGRLSGAYGCSELAGSGRAWTAWRGAWAWSPGWRESQNSCRAAGWTETGSPEMQLTAPPMLRPWRWGGRGGVDGLSFVHRGRTCTQPGGPAGGIGVSEGCACGSPRDRQMETETETEVPAARPAPRPGSLRSSVL